MKRLACGAALLTALSVLPGKAAPPSRICIDGPSDVCHATAADKGWIGFAVAGTVTLRMFRGANLIRCVVITGPLAGNGVNTLLPGDLVIATASPNSAAVITAGTPNGVVYEGPGSLAQCN